jgi:hypothetical protein
MVFLAKVKEKIPPQDNVYFCKRTHLAQKNLQFRKKIVDKSLISHESSLAFTFHRELFANCFFSLSGIFDISTGAYLS